jgi:hypothetical protein
MTFKRSLAFGLVALLALASTPANASEFSERLASWQGGSRPAETPPAAAPAQPRPIEVPAPPAESAYYEDDFHGPTYWGGAPPESYGYGCGSCGTCGLGCGSCCEPACGCNTLVWARFEALLWWREGRDLPPLVTTDPSTEPSTTAGILPDATILFGGDTEPSDMSVGGRFDVGFWTDLRQCYGIGWRFFGLGTDGLDFAITSLDNPVLAVPVVDFATGNNDAVLVAYPGLRTGSISVGGESELYGNDVYGRFLLCRNCVSRWDFITGYHFSRINDSLELTASITDVTSGTQDIFRDQFATRSEFHGGILGLMWERECGCLTTQVMARMSLGGMHEEVAINGTRTIIDPGQDPVVVSGGIFTAGSNIGTYERTEFTAVTEVGVNLGYRVGNCTELTVGYTFLYWHDVQRVGDTIDTAIGTAGGVTRPQFDFADTGFWVQGLSLGFVREF